MGRFQPNKKVENDPIIAAYKRSNLGPGLGWRTNGAGKRLFQFWASPAERKVEICSTFDLTPTNKQARILLASLGGEQKTSFQGDYSACNEVEDLRALFISSLNAFSQMRYHTIISQQHNGRVVWGARVVFLTPVGVVRLGPIVFLKDCPPNINFNANAYSGILYSSQGRSFHRADDGLPDNFSVLSLQAQSTQSISIDPFLLGDFETSNQRVLDKTYYLPSLSRLQNFNISFEVIRALTKAFLLSAYRENCLRKVFVLLGDVPVSIVELLSVSNIQEIYDSLINRNQTPFTVEVPVRNFLNKDLTVGLSDTFKLRYDAEIEKDNFRTLKISTPPSIQPEKLAWAIGWLLAAVRENVLSNDNDWKRTNLCILYNSGRWYERLMIYSPDYIEEIKALTS